jgi:hypothetical protein
VQSAKWLQMIFFIYKNLLTCTVNTGFVAPYSTTALPVGWKRRTEGWWRMDGWLQFAMECGVWRKFGRFQSGVWKFGMKCALYFVSCASAMRVAVRCTLCRLYRQEVTSYEYRMITYNDEPYAPMEEIGKAAVSYEPASQLVVVLIK